MELYHPRTDIDATLEYHAFPELIDSVKGIPTSTAPRVTFECIVVFTPVRTELWVGQAIRKMNELKGYSF